MLHTKLTKSLLRTTDNYIQAFEKAGITSVKDLLLEFPREYDDRTEVLDTFSYINVKEKNTIIVKLLSINSQKTANNKILTKAVVEDKSGFLAECVWFNRKYLSTQLSKFSDKSIILSGKVKYAFGKVTFQSPEVETDLSKVWWEIVAVYSDVNYIPSKWTQWKMELVKKYITDFTDELPEHLIKKYDFVSKKEAIYKIHFPKNSHEIDQAKFRLGYEELFDINYKAIADKYKSFAHSEWKSLPIKMNPQTVKQIIAEVGFELTDHQKIVLFQTLKDMEKTHAMQRLLEWDVGTGKTVVAMVAGIHGILETRKQMNSNLGKNQENLTKPEKNLTQPLLRGEGQIEVESMRVNYKCVPDYVKDLCKTLRVSQTSAEKYIWDILRNRQLEWLKFRRQHPFWRYIADFYCDSIWLVLELDGKIHEKQKEYDEVRDEIITNYGVTIIRVSNEDVFENTTKVLEKILNFIPSPLRRGLGWGWWIEIGWWSEVDWWTEWSWLNNGSKNGVHSHTNSKNRNPSIQIAIMAPTEILARQHFEGMQEFFMKFNISSHLLVWSITAKQKKAVKADLKSGNIDVVIGTHALVQDDIIFANLWFVVIDEQHRFWVKQREFLEKFVSFNTGTMPHVLNMTATPIPRTLALTLYGDQDLSIISQYPKGRKDIFTKVVRDGEPRLQVENFVRSEVEKKRQVFWISPLVEESEKIDLANAVNTFETLKEIFFPHRVWLLHGKMKAKEKDEMMQKFADGEIDILSSTSVVEVGVNIPNATIMCIEWAERFGLSQLHQFRGRVWRWAQQSYCYLFPTKGNKTDRLKAMERTNNGFELAEIDLEIRGPGEVYGLRQSWVPDLKVASLTDLELISQIREDITEMFEKK